MPTFMNRLGQRISQAANSAVEKSKEMVEIAKLSKQISDAGLEITRLEQTIGSRFYAAYTGADDVPDMHELCKQIDQLYARIERLQLELDGIRGVPHCQGCGSPLEDAAKFCPNCGHKLTE